ncbi:hypothetical protein BC937DRAFT_93917 [Endogone sp. FLAS-F59071]|nr:hypothetical protein BC937DRAFT_93917 [Endogone sp. FLAS-F59071]|eukprot:RUS14379.1 hypothetical protein BC937DRAFT_93917 [Endogone sp. FLAS-F59071]
MNFTSASREPLQRHFGLEARVIAAIDFGTSHSGHAMTHIIEVSPDIKAFYNWPEQPVSYCKNLTAIRYKTEPLGLVVESWGYSARRNHMTKASDKSTCRYFDRFKLYLDEVAAQKLPELPSGFIALDIIADYLHNLYLRALKDIQSTWGANIRPNNIVWFLTVPAMWSEKAKQDMREAAVVAGLVSPEDINNKDRLNIVLEPEAAAMYCCQQSEQYLLQPGETFMIVDAGGGTIDLTAHEILYDPVAKVESLREITHGSGRSCGSTFIDEAFIQFVKVQCGSNNRQFEGDVCFEQCIPLPPRLRQLMKKSRVVDPEMDDDDFTDDDLEDITITSEDCFAMFDPIVNSALELVELQYERSCKALAMYRSSMSSSQDTMSVGACKIDKMFFVGGFSASEYLWRKAIERFGSRIKMYRPLDPGSAVVKGAVLCGKFPRFIGSRCSRYAYGVKTTGRWTSNNPNESAKKWNEAPSLYVNQAEQTFYADNLFRVMADVGQPVGIDEVISERFVPVITSQEFATLELFTTDLAGEEYMVDSMVLAATLQVPLSTPVRIQFVQDVSASMDGEKLQASKVGLKEICRKLTQADEVGLIRFGSKVETISVIQPYSPTIENQINNLAMLGMTALNDAIAEGIQSLKRRAEISTKAYRNILLISTDGEENVSKTSFDDVSALIQNSGIPNFRIVLAVAGSIETNSELVGLYKSEECRSYCEVISVEDSSDGIRQAYAEMDQMVKLYRAGQEQGSNVIRLDLRFGATQISADAVVEGTDVRTNVNIQFHAKTDFV